MCSMVIMLCTKRIIHAYTLCRWVGDLRGHPRGGRGLRLEEVDVLAVEGGRLNRRRVGKWGSLPLPVAVPISSFRDGQ
ncbi:hypothetical protein AMTR_s00052p00212640 [Amborella trichopoda]|uniref:Uncharacterized protein n=1 Tax=Amborella trichopoda TaxID=13333 RepID=U5D7W3_AMBTC|nr:hypothetical protein AMTR_s00052p00212640 [Amborella trichopoda]